MKTKETTTAKTLTTKKKAVVGAAAILGACTLLFGAAAQSVLAAEGSKQSTIPTTYPAALPQQEPKGYSKVDYNIVSLSEANRATANDITMETAAEIGAQNLWKLFGVELGGKTIEMNYSESMSSNERATWWGYVSCDGDSGSDVAGRMYSFQIDAVSGALYSVGVNRTFQDWTGSNLADSVDPTLETNCEVYKDLARAVAEQHQLLNGKLKSVTYSGQGYGNNDPTISLTLTSDAGEEMCLTFSRRDKALLGYTSSLYFENSQFGAVYDPVVAQEEASNSKKLDPSKAYDAWEGEDGGLYVEHINEKGEKEILRIGHTPRYLEQ